MSDASLLTDIREHLRRRPRERRRRALRRVDGAAAARERLKAALDNMRRRPAFAARFARRRAARARPERA
jgi:hypothetical protein